jgi:CubicO group peptidase (beta-lactamase class C family)
MNAQPAAKPASAPQTPSLPHAKPESLGLSPVRLQHLSDAFKREVDKGTLPGATVLVARKGQIGWFDAIGRQSPEASAPMARDTLFRIFSMTKPIVSVGIMMLLRKANSCSPTPSPNSSPNSPGRRSASSTTANWNSCP